MPGCDSTMRTLLLCIPQGGITGVEAVQAAQELILPAGLPPAALKKLRMSCEAVSHSQLGMAETSQCSVSQQNAYHVASYCMVMGQRPRFPCTAVR
jgi:hypothetical protein